MNLNKCNGIQLNLMRYCKIIIWVILILPTIVAYQKPFYSLCNNDETTMRCNNSMHNYYVRCNEHNKVLKQEIMTNCIKITTFPNVFHGHTMGSIFNFALTCGIMTSLYDILEFRYLDDSCSEGLRTLFLIYRNNYEIINSNYRCWESMKNSSFDIFNYSWYEYNVTTYLQF
jgi:hypothetical protein